MSLTIGPLAHFGLFFPVVCFVLLSDQTLVDHPYRLLATSHLRLIQNAWNAAEHPIAVQVPVYLEACSACCISKSAHQQERGISDLE